MRAGALLALGTACPAHGGAFPKQEGWSLTCVAVKEFSLESYAF